MAADDTDNEIATDQREDRTVVALAAFDGSLSEAIVTVILPAPPARVRITRIGTFADSPGLSARSEFCRSAAQPSPSIASDTR
jgi:hypothetical protein